MRILQINASYKPAFIYGGPTMSVSMLCEQLVKKHTEVMVFTTTANGAAELPVTLNNTVNVDGVQVTYFKRLTKDHTHFSPALLSRLWHDVKKYNVVHIHAWWNMVSVLSCLIAVLRGVPVIVSPRGTLSPYSFSNKNRLIKMFIHQILGKPLLNKCYLHVTSQRESAAMSDLVQPKEIFNLPNFVKLADKSGVENTPGTPIKLLFFSRIEEKKGLDILLDALAKVSVPYHLTIAGNGDADYIAFLKKQANKLGIDKNITWAGFYNDNKFDLLRQHDLFILPSHDENFANTVIEGLSVGTAVLLSQNVGLYDYVQQQNLGWVCKADAAELSNSINNITNNHKDDLLRIRKDAPATILHDFNPDNLVEKYLAMYNQTTTHE
ncbi:MAG: glycosyltransferase [Sphingobacteriaceae bacterium]|nr:MAG: glycosyltransferase [Sphingobacteriaceae bacterium]